MRIHRYSLTQLGAASLLMAVGCSGTGGTDPGDSPTGTTGQTGTDSATTDPTTTGPGTTHGTTGDSGTASESSTETGDTDSTATDSSGSSGGVRFDLGPLPDSPPAKEGCERVDFLFVIDDSDSMADHQANLVNSFPAFITGIQGTLASVDSYHVGVVTTDEYLMNTPNCQTLGSLVVQTGGYDSSDATCGPFMEGYNFITETDDLGVAFQCAALPGTDGDLSELPMQALRDVVNEVDGGAGQCNEQFLRSDSLLVVVVLTDEADGPGDGDVTYLFRRTSPGTPLEWFNDVVAARGGTEENIVVMSLINYYGGLCSPDEADFIRPEIADGKNIKEFTEMFTHGIVGGVCELDYGPYFQRAVGVIDSACDSFQPPG